MLKISKKIKQYLKKITKKLKKSQNLLPKYGKRYII